MALPTADAKVIAPPSRARPFLTVSIPLDGASGARSAPRQSGTPAKSWKDQSKIG
jgi:hypothetical protein